MGTPNPYYKVPYTAVQDNSIVDLDMVKLHLRVDSTIEDDLIQLYLDGAKRKADTYLQNTFTDQSGNQKDIPGDIEVWILQTVSKFYFNRTIGVMTEQITDTGSVTYATLSDIDINYDLIKSYRHTPGFGGFFA